MTVTTLMNNKEWFERFCRTLSDEGLRRLYALERKAGRNVEPVLKEAERRMKEVNDEARI